MLKAKFENNQLCINEEFLKELLKIYKYKNEGTKYAIKFNSYFASYFIVEKIDNEYYKIVPTTSRNNERPALQLEAYWELCKDRNVKFEGEIPLFYKQWFVNRGLIKKNREIKKSELRQIIKEELKNFLTEMPYASYSHGQIAYIDFRIENMNLSVDEKKKLAKAFYFGNGIYGKSKGSDKWFRFTPKFIKNESPRPGDVVLPSNWWQYAIIRKVK